MGHLIEFSRDHKHLCVGISNDWFFVLNWDARLRAYFYFRLRGWGLSFSREERPSFSERMGLRWYTDICGVHIRLLRRGQ